MTLTVDVYWSVRSPYCYLATPRLYRLQRDYDVECRIRPVYPHALRDPDALRQRSGLWLEYFKLDIARAAAFLGMPLRWPHPDPVATDPQTGRPAAEQPLVRRLTKLIAAAEEEGRGLAFIHELSAVLWSPAIPDWTTDGHLERVCEKSGLSLTALDARIISHPARYEGIIDENDQRERVAGHWGVPVMVFEGEPFFGQDRIDMLYWRLDKRGLAPRKSVAAL